MCKRLAGVVAASVVAACLAGPAPAHSPVTAADPSGLAACHHYDNRARFMPRDGDVEFVAVLAEACAAAGEVLEAAAGDSAQRAAAARFMAALGAARAEIGAIDRARMTGPRPLAARGAAAVEFRKHQRLISLSGEFLILREMGVFRAMRDWVASGADFTLARALP